MNMNALSNAGANICSSWNTGNQYALDLIDEQPNTVAAAGTGTALAAVITGACTSHPIAGIVFAALEAVGLQGSIMGHSMACGADESSTQSSLSLANNFVSEVPSRDYEMISNAASSLFDIGSNLISGSSEPSTQDSSAASETVYSSPVEAKDSGPKTAQE